MIIHHMARNVVVWEVLKDEDHVVSTTLEITPDHKEIRIWLPQMHRATLKGTPGAEPCHFTHTGYCVSGAVVDDEIGLFYRPLLAIGSLEEIFLSLYGTLMTYMKEFYPMYPLQENELPSLVMDAFDQWFAA